MVSCRNCEHFKVCYKRKALDYAINNVKDPEKNEKPTVEEMRENLAAVCLDYM